MGRCHREAFVTSDQKESRKKNPNKLQNTTFVMQADQHSPILKGKYKIYPYMSQGFGSTEAWRFAMGHPHLTSFSTKVRKLLPWEMVTQPHGQDQMMLEAKEETTPAVNSSTGLPELAWRRRGRSVYEMFLISCGRRRNAIMTEPHISPSPQGARVQAWLCFFPREQSR